MPVSRSRKRKSSRKSSKSTRSSASRRAARRDPGDKPQRGPGDQSPHDLRAIVDRFAPYRTAMLARRAAAAALEAETVVADLVELAPTRTDSDLEGELCSRIGPLLHECDDVDALSEDYFGPYDMAGACVTTAAAEVRVVVANAVIEPDEWRVPWRVLAAVARVVPSAWQATAVAAVEELRRLPSGHLLLETLDGPIVTGPVLWTCDAYGSRFGVTTAFSAPDGPDRWYLWDIDTCCREPLLVHSAYYPTAAEALASWQAGVGPVAAGESVLTPVDDPWLLAEIMPHVEELRAGGEDVDQYAEYLRSRRLAEEAIQAVGLPLEPAPQRLDATTATTEFAAWLREHRAEYSPSADHLHLEVLTKELTRSWCTPGPVGVFRACSPHRVAAVRLHMLDYYQDDFAAELVALLPPWISWLAERNTTPAELVERCRPYALGEPHPDIDDIDRLRARVRE